MRTRSSINLVICRLFDNVTLADRIMILTATIERDWCALYETQVSKTRGSPARLYSAFSLTNPSWEVTDEIEVTLSVCSLFISDALP